MVSENGVRAPPPDPDSPANNTLEDADITQKDIRMGNSSDTFFSDIEINSDEENQTGGILNGLQLDISGDNSLLLSLAAPETPYRGSNSEPAHTQAPAQDLSTQAKIMLERHKQAVLEADYSSWSDHIPDDIQVMGTPIEPAINRPKLVPRAPPIEQVDSEGEDTGFVQETPFKSPPLKMRKMMPEPRAIGTPLRDIKQKNTIPGTPPKDQCLFVHWPGDGWYPALILDREAYYKARETPKMTIVVEFGTEEEGTVKASSAVPVDLQEGDFVRYEGMKYKITALKESGRVSKFVTTAGFDTLTIEPARMSRRMNLDIITVPLKDIFLRDNDFQVWNAKRISRATKQRTFYASRILSNAGSAPRMASLKAAPTASDIFKDCMFSVTMASHENAKSINAAIVENSGWLVEDFEDVLAIEPDGRAIWKADGAFTFAAVIAARPLRSPKYLGGLAVGWPCLSFQFVLDCIAAGRFLDNWKDYVLAAGDSIALDSPISLDVSDFYTKWTLGHSLATQFYQRSLALGGLVPNMYLVRDSKDRIVELLAQISSARPPKIVNSIDEVTEKGAVIVLARPPSNTASAHPSISTKDTLSRLSKQLVLPATVIYNRDWLIQCIINRRLV